MRDPHPLKVFVAALAHETNTFSPLPTTLRSFEEGFLHRPGNDATIERALHFSGYGDVVAAVARVGDKCVLGPCAWAQPSGPLSRASYESLRDEMLDALRAQPVDVVALFLHGAMVAEGYPDCEGDILTRVREVVGPDVPIGALLDLHGNVSRAMVDGGVILVACKEYPHTDYPARADELYRILRLAKHEVIRPQTVLRRVGMVGIFGTTEGPMRDFVTRMKTFEGVSGILSVSAMHGFPWSDTACTSSAFGIVHDGETSRTFAEEVADLLADEFFHLRWSFPQRLPLDAALDQALKLRSNGGPVVFADGSDNPGGGAACDSTFVLRELLRREIPNAALGMIWDPQATSIAADAGVGARLPLRFGGKVGPMSGEPIDSEVEVLSVREDGTQRGLDAEGREPLGLAVGLRILGVDVVLNTIRQQVFSPDCFSELGIDVRVKDLVVVKSTQHFRSAFDAIAAATVYCDTPGTLNSNLRALPYRHIRRPLWPLDDIDTLHAHDREPS